MQTAVGSGVECPAPGHQGSLQLNYQPSDWYMTALPHSYTQLLLANDVVLLVQLHHNHLCDTAETNVSISKSEILVF